jgi:hypothetical protein
MPDISTIVSLFSMLKSGVELAERFDQESIDVVVRARKTFFAESDGIHGPAALAELVITNRSDLPQSITDITISLGERSAIRIPAFETKFRTISPDYLSAVSPRFQADFEVGESDLHYFDALPSDVYLRQNESKSGLVLFKLPSEVGDGEAELNLTVGANRLLSASLPVDE